MLYAVIDIGSNSARLMMHDGEKTLYKKVKITRLAENMGEEKILTKSAIDRTALAIKDFIDIAKNEKADKIFAFATAAVRYAKNSTVFLNRVKELCGIDVEVVSGDVEAVLGYNGALCGSDGGVVDIGGASAEIIVCENGKEVYAKSLDIGVVKLKDKCGQDRQKVLEYVDKKIKEYGNIPSAKFYGIGGTATSIASILLELEKYNPDLVN
jgi:exopolyphosphatase/guanosine-5'-triphosphate,3'-diphosphate pyrophosphatase